METRGLWEMIGQGLCKYTGPDFEALLYRNDQHHPQGELRRRPSQLPSKGGWSVVGDTFRSPIRGIRNFGTLDQAKESIEDLFSRYRLRLERDGLTAQQLRQELRESRQAEDHKYQAQVSLELNRLGPRAPRIPAGNLQLRLLS